MQERAQSFGYWLRRRRKALDLTQEALARLVSCSRFAIRKIEADERRPSRGLAERLAEKLAVPAEEREAFLEIARAVHRPGALGLDAAPLEAPVTPIAGAPFVGRGDEMASLLPLLAPVAAGSGHVVLLEGEPGIGKSRMIEELARHCGAQGMRTLVAKCYEIERAMAYQPVVGLVTRALELDGARAASRLAPSAMAEIAALVPSLGEQLVARASTQDFPEARQARLFQAMLQLFEAAAGGAPLVLVVDDVQWADEASMQFIHYAGRMAASRALLLVCAYRDEDLATHDGLATLVESLGREAHARRMTLARLRPDETQALLDRFGPAIPAQPGLAQRLHRETGGNPFFLLSMAHALAQGEAPADAAAPLPLPDALRAAVRARLAHLNPASRTVLDVAALIGRRFDFDTLLAVTRKPEEELLDALESLVKRRLLRDEPEDGFHDFTHDKVREVVYREMSAPRRMALHRAVAEVLEKRGDDEAGAREGWLAEHYERAHAWKKAVQYLVLAAERSKKLFAMRDALHWLDRAVSLAESHPGAIDAAAAIELYGQRGAARALAGHTAEAVADIQRVIDDARRRGDRAAARDGVIRLGMTYRRADDYVRATECLEQALAESRALGDERQAADTLYHLGTVTWSEGHTGDATAYHSEAVAICERLGLEDLVAVQAYHGRGEAHYDSLEPRAAIACYERSIDLARRIGDRSYESENLMMIGFACAGYMGLADYARAEASLNASLDIARRADLQWHMGPTLLGLDHLRACRGQYGEAWAGMTKTLAWLESVRQTRYQLIAYDLLGHLLIESGLHERAVEMCDRGIALALRAGISFWRPRIEAHRAIAQVRMGDASAQSTLERVLEECGRDRASHQAARALEGLAEAAHARGDVRACLAHADALLALAEPSGLTELAANARLWRGEAFIVLGEREEAERELAAVAEVAVRVGRSRLAADAHGALARLHALGRSQRESARHARLETEFNERIVRSLEGSELAT